MKPTLAIVIGALFMGVMFGGVGSAIIPAQLHLAGPVACPDHDRTVVVRTVTSVRPGETSITADLWCLDGPGPRRSASGLASYGVIIGGWTLLWLLLLATGLRRRRRRPDPTPVDGQAPPVDAGFVPVSTPPPFPQDRR